MDKLKPDEKHAPQLTCSRASLLMYAQGDLIVREGTNVLACDERDAEAAVEAMDRGETILLLDAHDRVCSRMRVVDGAYKEEPIGGTT